MFKLISSALLISLSFSSSFAGDISHLSNGINCMVSNDGGVYRTFNQIADTPHTKVYQAKLSKTNHVYIALGNLESANNVHVMTARFETVNSTGEPISSTEIDREFNSSNSARDNNLMNLTILNDSNRAADVFLKCTRDVVK